MKITEDIFTELSRFRELLLIAEGIAALAKELANKTMPVPDLVEWFAEWANDARSDQRALLLLTAHRSKGVEFDHVVILNGGWDRPSKGEDPDAPRLLFNVAMTRARRSLAIIAEREPSIRPAGRRARAAPSRANSHRCGCSSDSAVPVAGPHDRGPVMGGASQDGSSLTCRNLGGESRRSGPYRAQ